MPPNLFSSFQLGFWRFFIFIYLFWLHCAGFSSCGERGLIFGAQASHCGNFLRRGAQALALAGRGLRVVAHRLSCSAAYGVFLDQGTNPCLLHWQVDSLSLSHQGSPVLVS